MIDKMDSQVLLSYSGKIDYETHETLVERAKNLTDLENVDQVIKKRLIYIIIEGLENIYKHSDFKGTGEAEKKTADDNFSLSASDNCFVVNIGNQVNSLKAGLLKVKLDYINKLDSDSLKQYYNEVITNGVVSDNSGAGLGMIRIALKSSNHINYKLERLENDYYYFNMWVELPKLLKRV